MDREHGPLGMHGIESERSTPQDAGEARARGDDESQPTGRGNNGKRRAQPLRSARAVPLTLAQVRGVEIVISGCRVPSTPTERFTFSSAWP